MHKTREGQAIQNPWHLQKIFSISRDHSEKSWCVIMQIYKPELERLAEFLWRIEYLALKKVNKEKKYLLSFRLPCVKILES